MTPRAADTPELVIFDLDGTLIDSAAGTLASFRHAMAAVDADVPGGDLVTRIVGPPLNDTMHSLGLGDDRAEAAIAAYRADYTRRGWAMSTLFDGVAELLADLRAAGVRLAVATSKPEPTARRILRHFGVADAFEVIAGARMDGTGADKAEVLGRALAQLDPVPDRVVMVGDRAHDVDGAAQYGIGTVVAGWGYGASDFGDGAVAAPPAAHVMTVEELREVFGV